VAHCVDTTMKHVKSAGSNTDPNRVFVQPDSSELTRRDNAVLPSRNSRQSPVAAVDLVGHTATKSTQP
jgi:hypothetical protein